MASRSTRRRKSRRAEALDEEEGGVGAFFIRHRLAVGGLTAFAVAFSYVGANAIWYQPHAHGGAFFETRPATTTAATRSDEGAQAGQETVIRLERAAQEQPVATSATETQMAVKGDPVVETVQRVLADLNLYQGEIDGVSGPQTRNAVEAYRKMVGMEMEAGIDGLLLTQLGLSPGPQRPPPPPSSQGTDMMATASAVAGDARIMRIQAGLKAFGNDGIDIDGVVGARTSAAIREFQSLFGLPETGDPDEAVYVKMREIGLTD